MTKTPERKRGLSLSGLRSKEAAESDYRGGEDAACAEAARKEKK